MKKWVISLCLLGCFATAHAQSDVEYLMEVGAGAGLVAYEGDFNGNVFKEMQPMGSLMVRRLFSPRAGLRLAASYGKLKGSSANADTYYPDYAATPYTFDCTLADVSLTFEYNLWAYGTGRDVRGTHRLTPFIFGGIGGAYSSGTGESVFTGQVPLGLGLKYKIGDRLNLGVEWAAHFSLSDKLDGVADPYWVKSSGLFKNTDCYTALQVTLTYSFMAKCRTCHNADD